MAMTDPIADMLTRIRNAMTARHEQVDIPSSKIKLELARILKAEGFIKNYKVIQAEPQDQLRVFLKYDNQKHSAILGIEKLSKSGRRMYVSVEEIPSVRGGLGMIILSTNKGLVTDKQAKELKVGGELICKVW
jgi:small subunit ribosomal protein S8